MARGLELRSVDKGYLDRAGTQQRVLTGVSLAVDGGGTAILKGPSGSGKSTLLNLIAGLHLPDAGEVVVDGTVVSALREPSRDAFRAKRIGYVFQTFNLVSPLSALENLLVPAALCGEAADEKAAREILAELGLAGHLDKRPYELSVGQRQRVAVARAVLRRPSLLLADEPTANLDEESSRAVIEAMRRIRDGGATLVLATHDPILAEAFPGVTLDVVTGEVRR
jgi:putative ABC transport system ATP-binding protein